MDKETIAALQNLMTLVKRLGVDDDHFDDYMAVSDWLREHSSFHASNH